MITLNYLQKSLNDYLYFDSSLKISTIDSYMANGLLVKGNNEIQKIGFGVSASISLFRKAHEIKCDTIIVHHAFNLPANLRYEQIFQDRINFLLERKLTLFGYHFLLDAHPEIGNNVQILKLISADISKQYLHHNDPWGYIGIFKKPQNFETIKKIISPNLSRRSIYYQNKNIIRKIVAVSGKGAPPPSEMQNLMDEEIDLYITGEVHEWNRELFKEARISFIAGGHYHTEVFGIKALMKYMTEKFRKIECVWLDLENDV